jgi:hypothetical protein
VLQSKPASVGGLFYRVDKIAMAGTTSHSTMTNEAIAPAVIFIFSFVM